MSEMSNTLREADVIVVGAGFAGLKAAQDLVAAGRKVILLEANDRVGGRMKRGEVSGRVVDFGAQWIGKGHDFLLEQGRRYGIETYKQYDTGRTVMQLLGKLTQFTGNVPRMPFLSLLELFRLQKRWDREMKEVPPDAPWTARRAKEWDGQTLETWITRNVRTEAAREFARLVPRGAWAVEARNVSYLWYLDALRSAGGLDYLMTVKDGALDEKFKGGVQQVAHCMAEELGARVVLGAPVEKIAQDAAGVRVTTPKGEFRARRIIVSAPPAAAARIAYEPHLPALRDGLQQRMPMGNIIKVIVAYREAFWRARGFSGQVATDDDVVGLVLDDVQDIGPPILLCFIEGRHAIEMSAHSMEERKGAVLQSLAKFFGPEALDPIGYGDNDWMIEPYTHGYVGHMPPGTMTRFGRALREPCGRIHWAGTETATEWAGYLEGALRSGARAAAEVARMDNV